MNKDSDIGLEKPGKMDSELADKVNNGSGQAESSSLLPPPPVLTMQTQDKNFFWLLTLSHSSLERKLDTWLASVEDQLQMLNTKFCE